MVKLLIYWFEANVGSKLILCSTFGCCDDRKIKVILTRVALLQRNHESVVQSFLKDKSISSLQYLYAGNWTKIICRSKLAAYIVGNVAFVCPFIVLYIAMNDPGGLWATNHVDIDTSDLASHRSQSQLSSHYL